VNAYEVYDTNGHGRGSNTMRGLRTSFFRADHRGPGRAGPSRALWTVLATSAALALTSPAEAALYYWPSYSSVYVQPAPPPPPWRAKIRRHAEKKIELAAKETAKPQGPLIIAISIEKQSLKLYDANGLFAESPVSTGMRGHPTPLGVFSVIQKQKMHRSNIYSGAPMPYMQRITWSGVALHAGVLPGYPASHGCIRMPTAFAIKMWAWTRMGARVIITPGEITPAAFSHPLLASRKPAPPSAEAGLPPAEPLAKSGQAGPQDSVASAAASAPELRTTLGHEDVATPGAERAHPTRTADADSSSASPPATLSDAGPSSSVTLPPTETPKTDSGAPAAIAPKDPSRSGEVPAAKADPAPPKRIGQIAVFVSRKDAKLYVRQNFEPLFDVPVTIAPSEHPLGTHVFTAEVDKADSSQLHWSVISLPPANRHEADTAAHKRKIASAAETRPAVLPDSAGEALDRLSLPAEAMSRIAELLSNGSSIIVSDLGIGAGETGEGTEFLVPLR